MGENPRNPFPMERTMSSLSDLRNIGVFDEKCGLIFGRPYAHDEAMRERSLRRWFWIALRVGIFLF